MNEIVIGDEFKTWCSSMVGKYIIKSTEDAETAILRELAEIDPHDTRRIQVLQSDAKALRLLLQFIAEAIARGEDAKFAIDQEDKFDG